MARPVLGVLSICFGILIPVAEDTAYIRVVAGSIPAMPTASYGSNSNAFVPG